MTMTATEAAEAATLPLSVGKLCRWERGGGLGAQTALLRQLIDSVRCLKPRKNTLGHGRRPDSMFEEDFFFLERTGAPRCFQIRLNIKTESLANLRLMKAQFVSRVFKARRNKVTAQIYAQTLDKHCCWGWRKVLCLSSPSSAAF